MNINRQYLTNILNFDEYQINRTLLMYNISQNISSSNSDLILKGGTALLFCYNLPRYSTDLDYDGMNYPINISDTIKSVFKNSNLNIEEIITKKDTETVKRLMIHYKEAEKNPLKIEISFRNIDNKNALDNKVNINGLNTYSINYLSNNKINTFLERAAARDIFDAAFLFQNYPKTINAALVDKCKNKLISFGLDQMEKTIKNDEVLYNIDCEQLLLNFDKNINKLSNNIKKSHSRHI